MRKVCQAAGECRELRREELIEVIDRLRSDSLEVGERARLLGIVHFEFAIGHMAPLPVRATFRRGLSYASLLLRRFGFVSKEEKQRFRLAEQSLGASIAFVVALAGATFFFSLAIGWVVQLIEFLDLGSLGSMLLSFSFPFVAIVIYLWALPRNVPAKIESYQRFRPWCIGCGYELEGLESALGDELWVGPAVCPECGQQYPAVGE